MKTLLILALVLLAGCARFSTKQTDERLEADGATTTITTVASSWTLWSSKSALANFKASQTEKTQGATVGTLNQEATDANTARIIEAVTAAAIKAATVP